MERTEYVRRGIATFVTIYGWLWVLTQRGHIGFLPRWWAEENGDNSVVKEALSRFTQSAATFAMVMITGIVWLLALLPAGDRTPKP
jgi:hypothetical protein